MLLNVLIVGSSLRLGRCECLEDLWIAGDLRLLKIKCNELAKMEATRLEAESNLKIASSFFSSDQYDFITFLNARSLRKHQKDIMLDPELMKSSILGIAETHLHVDEEVQLKGFEGNFVNAGKGKGVAAFNKVTVNNVNKICQPSFTAISLEMEKIKIVFAYMSSQINMEEVNLYLKPMLLEKKKPTIIMGDMNFHFSEKQNTFKCFLKDFGYHQLIEKVTHDEGHILDHIYVSDLDILSQENLCLKPLYFSDHDALCIRLEMELL